MGNSDDNGYSAAFVDGVLRDYQNWKNKNSNQQVITRIPAANPGAAPTSNNRNAGNGALNKEERDIFGKTKEDYAKFNNAINYGPNGMVDNIKAFQDDTYYLDLPLHIAKSPEYYEYYKKWKKGR